MPATVEGTVPPHLRYPVNKSIFAIRQKTKVFNRLNCVFQPLDRLCGLFGGGNFSLARIPVTRQALDNSCQFEHGQGRRKFACGHFQPLSEYVEMDRLGGYQLENFLSRPNSSTMEGTSRIVGTDTQFNPFKTSMWFMTSCALVAAISLLQPMDIGASIRPGTAKISRLCSNPISAVISEPEVAPASITTTPLLKPLIILFRAGKRQGSGFVPGKNSEITAPCVPSIRPL